MFDNPILTLKAWYPVISWADDHFLYILTPLSYWNQWCLSSWCSNTYTLSTTIALSLVWHYSFILSNSLAQFPCQSSCLWKPLNYPNIVKSSGSWPWDLVSYFQCFKLIYNPLIKKNDFSQKRFCHKSASVFKMNKRWIFQSQRGTNVFLNGGSGLRRESFPHLY